MSVVDSFHVMVKPVGPLCNLDCKYCFYLEKEKLYPGTGQWAMPEDVLDKYIRDYISSQTSPEITFAWQGGEPTLLGVDYFRRVVEFQEKYSNGKSITNAFQTNGVLLDDEWGEFFSGHKFLIGVSVDGPKEVHDRYRVNKGGRPSFDQVIRGMGFLKKHGVDFNTLTVVQRDNSYKPLEVYNFLKEIGSRYMQFIPVVERISGKADSPLDLAAPGYDDSAAVTDWSVEPVQYGNFLCAVFDEWVRKDVGRIFVQLFDVSLEMWYGLQASLCVFRETCGDAAIIEHNGDVYSCDHYVYPENRLGNIMEDPLMSLMNSDQQRKFGSDKLTSLPDYCKRCEVRFACNGECPKHRFTRTPAGEPGLNYLCAAYKKFFGHIDVYMKYMASELRNRRPPANVMKWAQEKDKGYPSLKPDRNDPCPCGSGLKYKRCCGLRSLSNRVSRA